MADTKLLYFFQRLGGDVIHLTTSVLCNAAVGNAMTIVVSKETGKDLVNDGTHAKI